MDLMARLRSASPERWRKALVAAAALVLVFLTGLSLARLAWLVVEGPVDTGATAPPEALAPARQTAWRPEMADGWALFGEAQAQPGAGDTETASETDLPLQLLGVFSVPRNKALAGAVIAERGGEGRLFRVGDADIPGGATLEGVERDHVLLRRRGQLEILRFDEAQAYAGGVEASPAGRTDTLNYRRFRERAARAREDDAADEGEDDGARARNGVAILAEQLREDPDNVMNQLGLKPAGGGGYQVGQGEQSQLVRNLGLRPGDVILSLNGKPLGNARNDARMIDEVKESGEARLEIRRGTQTFTVNYPL